MLGALSIDWLLKLLAPLVLIPVVKLGLLPEKFAELVTLRFAKLPVSEVTDPPEVVTRVAAVMLVAFSVVTSACWAVKVPRICAVFALSTRVLTSAALMRFAFVVWLLMLDRNIEVAKILLVTTWLTAVRS